MVFGLLSQSWANDGFKIIVPNPIGSGSGDSIARKIAEIYNRQTGNNIVVVNIPGGNQIPAILAFKKEKAAATILVSSQLVYKTLPDDQLPYTDRDFFLLAELGENPNFFWTSSKTDLQNARDLINKLPRSSKPMIGYQSTLTMINIRSLAQHSKVDITPVGYKGVPEMLLNVLSGEILVGHGAIGGNAVMEYVRQGQLRLLGSTSSRPIKIGDTIVPSVSQQLGAPQFNGFLWLGVTPGIENTPMGQTLRNIVQSKEMQDYLNSIFLYPTGQDPNVVVRNMREQAERHKNLFVTN